MRTFDRYFAVIFLKNLLLSSVGMAVVLAFQGFLAQALDADYTLLQVLNYQALGFPDYLAKMVPPGTLMAAALTFSELNRHSELVAAHSLGISLGRMLKVLFSLVFIVCCGLLVIQDRLLPRFHRAQSSFYWSEMKQRPNFFLDVRRNKVWYRSRNDIYNLQVYEQQTGVITGMSVYRLSDRFKLKELIQAERARFEADHWVLTNGTITEFQGAEKIPRTKSFGELSLKLKETPRDFEEIEREVDSLRIKDLYRYINKSRDSGADIRRLEVKFHSRLSSSVMPFVMALLAVPFSRSRKREGGVGRDLGVGLAVTFFYWLFNGVGLSLGTNGALSPPLAAWLPSLIFSGVAIALIARKKG